MGVRNNSNLGPVDVSQNINLTGLNVDGTGISSLDVSSNTQLFNLSCTNNALSNLDVSALTNLGVLVFSSNNISSIDVGQNPNLFTLIFFENNLTSLDISNNTFLGTLSCSANQIETLDLTANAELTFLSAHTNNLSSLTVKNGNNTILSTMRAYNNSNLLCIEVDDEDFANNQAGWEKDAQTIYSEDCSLGVDAVSELSLALYPNPAIQELRIESNAPIEKIRVYSSEGRLVLQNVNSEFMDVQALRSGLYFAEIQMEGKRFVERFLKN